MMITMVPRDNAGSNKVLYNLQYNMIPKRGRAIAYTQFARPVVTIVRRARFTILLTIFLQILCSLFSSFVTIYTRYYSFCLSLLFVGTTASNGKCLYLDAAVSENSVPSFCFGECDREMPLFGVTE